MHEDQVETTAYSLSPASPVQPDRRADERFVRLLRVGAIMVEGRRELCLVRNLSAGGMMIRAYSPIPIGTSVAVEFKNGDPITGIVQWVQDGLTGVQFARPIDIVTLLAADAAGPQPRLPRIDLECSAWVRQQARLVRTKVLNVSQGGVCMRARETLALGGEVVTTLPGLTPVPGVVKWGKGDTYGIAFNRPLPLSDLVEWLQERQSAEQRLAG